MKKLALQIALAAAVLVAAVSCQQEEIITPDQFEINVPSPTEGGDDDEGGPKGKG